MLSFSFSTFLVLLLLYLPPVTIAKKRTWKDPVPCKNFYDKGQEGDYKAGLNSYEEEWRGGTDCWCPPYEGEDIEKYGNNFYWYKSGSIKGRKFLTNWIISYFCYIQSPIYAQNWHNCDPTALGVENVNLEWAAIHCDSIPVESGVNGWGNSYDIPDKKTAPMHVCNAMRCEYPDRVAGQCLCPEKDPPEGGVPRCSKRMWEWHDRGNRWNEWGKYNYSSPEYCWKLNTIIAWNYMQ